MAQWEAHRSNKDYASADALKNQIEAAGVKLTAGPDGPQAELLEDYRPAKLEGVG